MTAIVTGGAGFVGAALLEALRARGERARSFDLQPGAHCDDLVGSIMETDQLISAFDGSSVIYHLAGNAQLWNKDESVFDAINYRGTENVLEAALKSNVRRVVFCSSLTTLVGVKTPIGVSDADETIEMAPEDLLGPYPASKRRAELAALAAWRDHGLDVVIAMPTEPLGPGDEAITPPTRMLLDFARGATPAYIDCILNFTPLASLAAGMIAVADAGRPGERYLLGGENTPMKTLLEAIEEETGTKTPKTRLPYGVALAAGVIETKLVSPITGKPPKAPLTGVRLAGRNVRFSSEKAARDLGWRSASYRPALHETLEWFVQKGWLKP